MCGKIFRIYDVHIPKKCIESTHFYSCLPLPAQNSPPSSCHYILGRKKYSFPRQIFLKISFPQEQKGVGKLSFALSKFNQII